MMYSSGATPQPCMCTAKFPQQFIASQSYTSLEWSETVRVKRTTRGLCADSDLIPTPWIGLMGAKKIQYPITQAVTSLLVSLNQCFQ